MANRIGTSDERETSTRTKPTAHGTSCLKSKDWEAHEPDKHRMTRLTCAQRKAIRDAGPFVVVEDGPYEGARRVLYGHGPVPYAHLEDPDTDDPRIDILAALNAIASEPEAVTVAREALLTQLAKYPLEGGVSKADLNAIAKFRSAIIASRREALRAKRARK